MEKDEIKLLISVVERGKGDGLIQLLREKKIFFSTAFLGRGTAPSAWAELWTGESKKEVVLSVVSASRVEETMKSIVEKFSMHKAGHGIVFSVDIGSIVGKRALDYSLSRRSEK